MRKEKETRVVEMPKFSEAGYKGFRLRYANVDGQRVWVASDIAKAIRRTCPIDIDGGTEENQRFKAFVYEDGKAKGPGLWLVTDDGAKAVLTRSIMGEARNLLDWLDNASETLANETHGLTTVDFFGMPVRGYMDDDKPWLIATDVCDALDLDRTAIRRINERFKGVRTTHTLGGQQQVTVVTEPGVYALAFKSRKDNAVEFQDFIFEKVLPEIRRTGGYAGKPGQRLVLSDPGKDMRKTQAFDRLIAHNAFSNEETMGLGNFCSIVTDGKLGRTTFFNWLRERGLITKSPEGWNIIAADWVGRGLFSTTFTKGRSKNLLFPVIRVTRKGQEFLINEMNSCGVL